MVNTLIASENIFGGEIIYDYSWYKKNIMSDTLVSKWDRYEKYITTRVFCQALTLYSKQFIYHLHRQFSLYTCLIYFVICYDLYYDDTQIRVLRIPDDCKFRFR